MSDPLRTGVLFVYRNNGTDHSGNGWNLPAVGAPGTAEDLFTGEPDGSMLLPPGSNFDNGPGGGSPITPAQPFTLSLWGNFNGFVAAFIEARLIITAAIPITYFTALELIRFNGSIYVRGFFANTNVTVQVPAADATVRHNAMSSWDGTTAKLYLDGVLVASQAVGAPDPAAYFDEIINNGSIKQQLFVGWNYALDDGGISVGQAALPGSDVARNFNNNNGFDPTLIISHPGNDDGRWPLSFGSSRTAWTDWSPEFVGPYGQAPSRRWPCDGRWRAAGARMLGGDHFIPAAPPPRQRPKKEEPKPVPAKRYAPQFKRFRQPTAALMGSALTVGGEAAARSRWQADGEMDIALRARMRGRARWHSPAQIREDDEWVLTALANAMVGGGSMA